jgi:nucleoside-diphosphate-sugar epimerase/quercetin dioxygenase-like cupin family protein/2-polyprenyl-3-methyl-5-hydroxy-6-metoxy-1,4-benzoquinol methylase
MQKQKIVITGGLGYIGSKLCEIYSGETRYKHIVVVDQRFFADRVKQLRDWGFEFVQACTLDAKAMNDVLHDADIVHHLAGVTDVARIKNESSEDRDEHLHQVAVDGTNNVINLTPSHCKIIFPSTHVVFEGFETTKFDITESDEVSPILTYSKSKYINEIDLKNSGKNFIILRLGSVYGYATDTMRLNIMPNLFSKMAAFGSTIKLFGAGAQYKSLVSLTDVARCFKFMAESNYNCQIFNLTNENMTVKQVADIIKIYKPTANIIETQDAIPNLGYTLSNKKLLATGFKFLYNITDSIKEMITNWSPRDTNPDLEYIIHGDKEFIDSRGKISNYELPEPINLIGYIESKKGTVRANHYHPIQEQKCLLIKGKYISVIKDLADPKAQIKTQIINEGDIAVIKPNVAHTMVFLEDSIFLNLVNGEREHINYGITHTIPYTLVDEEFRKNLMEHYCTECRVSGSKKLLSVISLGLSPLANNLLNSQEDKDELYPLELVYCPESHNCQLSYVVPADKMFKHYLYASSTAKSFRDHFEAAAVKYIKDFNLSGKQSLVVDIGSNDGIGLKPFKDRGINVLGVEPATNIAEIAISNDIPTINDYFTDKVVSSIINSAGHADIVTASNVFAHADGLKEIANATFNLLKEDGCFIVEVQYLYDTINDLTFDNIYHEHVNYWSVTSINKFFKDLGYTVTDIEHVNTHGGSIRVYVKKSGAIPKTSVAEFLKYEEDFGLTDYETYKQFANRIEIAKNNVVRNINELKSKGLMLVGYGSPAKATTSLNYYGITSNEINYIIEDNALKHNKILPGVRIPIYSKEKLKERLPDVIVVMAWNFVEEIKKNNHELIDRGVHFVSIKDLQYPDFVL